MRLTTLLWFLGGVALLVTDVQAQRSKTCVPDRNQLILRKKIAEINTTEGMPGKEQLRSELDRLRQDGKITAEQYAEFSTDLGPAPGEGNASAPEPRAKADRALEQAMRDAQASETPPPPVSTAEQARAQEALQRKLRELETTPAPRAPAREADQSAAQKALDARMAELNRNVNLTPMLSPGVSSPAVTPAPAPSADAGLAQRALDEKMAELNRPPAPTTPVVVTPPPQPTTRVVTPTAPAAPSGLSDADAERAQRALAEKMAELERARPTVAVTPPPAAPPVAPPPPQPTAPAAPVVAFPTDGSGLSDADVARAQQALAEKMAELDRAHAAAAAAPPAPAAPVAPPPPAPVVAAPAPAPTPAEEPPPDAKLTAVGMERLAQLNQLYREGKVTPQDYHRERAQIIREHWLRE